MKKIAFCEKRIPDLFCRHLFCLVATVGQILNLLMSSFPECTEPDTVTKGGYSARSSSEPHPHPKKQRITSSSSSSSDSSDDTNGGKTKTRKKLETSSGIADRLSGLDRGKDESKLAFEVRVQAHRKLLRMVQW